MSIRIDGDNGSDWKQFLGQAQERLASAKERYGDYGFRCEGDAGAEGGEGGGGGGEGGQSVDLTNPAVQEAINAAVAREREVATARELGLRQNRDTILGEKKAWEAFGKPDEIQAKLDKLAELEIATKAGAVGADPDKFKSAVESAAQTKYEERARSLDGVISAKDTQIAELTAARDELAVAKHRAFVAEQMLRASVPEDHKIVQDGAWPYLIDTLAPLVVEQEVPGLGSVARLKVNDVLVPGSGPDNLMSLRELIPLARQGKGPVQGLGFCFVSSGKGSGTTTPGSGSTAGGNYWKMSEEQQTAFIKEHGMEKAKESMDNSPMPAVS